jgi:quercetin dioxygenase-like cupin family protein
MHGREVPHMIGNMNDIVAARIESPDALDASIRILVSPKEGWKDHVLRVIEIGPGGHTPKHSHAWFHVNLVLHGTGVLEVDGRTTDMDEGSYAFIPGGAVHQFRNAGTEPFRFLCIIPADTK